MPWGSESDGCQIKFTTSHGLLHGQPEKFERFTLSHYDHGSSQPSIRKFLSRPQPIRSPLQFFQSRELFFGMQKNSPTNCYSHKVDNLQQQNIIWNHSRITYKIETLVQGSPLTVTPVTVINNSYSDTFLVPKLIVLH